MARNPTTQPGLRMRMRGGGRRISSQHRRLDALYGRVLAALGRGSRGEAAEALERFVDAWDAHTSLEDEFYFPALRALRPAVTAELAAFSIDHRRLHKVFRGIEAQVAAGELEGAGDALVELAGHISHHEAGEEKLVAELTGGAG